jgi:hypothetical protein
MLKSYVDVQTFGGLLFHYLTEETVRIVAIVIQASQKIEQIVQRTFLLAAGSVVYQEHGVHRGAKRLTPLYQKLGIYWFLMCIE